MKRQFSLSTVFRMTEKSLLRKFFELFCADVEQLTWDAVNRRNIEPLHQLFDELPSNKRDQAEIALRHIHSLACEQGMEELRNAADSLSHDESWNDIFQSQKSLYTKSLLAWLSYRDIFDHAIQFFEVDSLTWWRKRLDLPKINPVFNINSRNRLEEYIETLLKTTQGRGYTCTVEMAVRPNGVYYFFAHPDDYVRDSLVHDDDKLLVHQTIRQTFEMVFAYNSIDGTSELSAKLPKRIKESLESLFLKHILGINMPEDEEKPFDLSMLLDPNFKLTVSPDDNLQVFVNGITVNWGTSYTVGYFVKGSDSVREFAFERLGDAIHHERIVVKKARFRFVFPQEGQKRPQTMTFEISPPFACTLKNQQPDRVEKAHYYLKQWRIEHAQEKDTDPQGNVVHNSGVVAGQRSVDCPETSTHEYSGAH
ncbi:MAG: hypothetical protein LBJ67_07065 [Planctomycetaceae bacterium]|jgi:hypothetical protein|nr:hypothetical protein [Planctomycetaceae bacterium]